MHDCMTSYQCLPVSIWHPNYVEESGWSILRLPMHECMTPIMIAWSSNACQKILQRWVEVSHECQYDPLNVKCMPRYFDDSDWSFLRMSMHDCMTPMNTWYQVLGRSRSNLFNLSDTSKMSTVIRSCNLSKIVSGWMDVWMDELMDVCMDGTWDTSSSSSCSSSSRSSSGIEVVAVVIQTLATPALPTKVHLISEGTSCLGQPELIVACIPCAPFSARNLVTMFSLFSSKMRSVCGLELFLIRVSNYAKIVDVENIPRTCREYVYPRCREHVENMSRTCLLIISYLSKEPIHF